MENKTTTQEKKKDNLKEAIKSFLYLPIKVGVEHNVICTCGKKMKIIGSGASFSEGDCNFKCACGNKLFLVWEFVKEFPSPYDKVRILIEKKEVPKKEEDSKEQQLLKDELAWLINMKKTFQMLGIKVPIKDISRISSEKDIDVFGERIKYIKKQLRSIQEIN